MLGILRESALQTLLERGAPIPHEEGHAGSYTGWAPLALVLGEWNHLTSGHTSFPL